MILHEMLKEERAEGKAEGISLGKTLGKAASVFELLEDLGPVPEDQRTKIMSETNSEVLQRWLKLAAKAKSMEQFLENM